MLVDFIAAHAPMIIAAVVLVPVLAFSIALFVEGARRTRWGDVRPARPVSRPVARPEPARRDPRRVMGGLGMRHGIAARRDHE